MNWDSLPRRWRSPEAGRSWEQRRKCDRCGHRADVTREQSTDLKLCAKCHREVARRRLKR